MLRFLRKNVEKTFNDADSFLEENPDFCIMPWVHFHVTQEGFVTPCCQAKWDKNLAFGDINTQTIDEIWKDKPINQFRKNMMKGVKHETCIRCYQKEEDGWTSLRNITNSKYQEEIVQVANKNMENFDKPVYLDIRFSNKCNLRCRICGPWSSSNWTHDFALLQGKKYQDSHITYGVKDTRKFMDQFINLVPYLKELYFAGGEPLMIDPNFDILELLIENNRTDVALFYNTNLTVLDYKSRPITELWKQFEKVTIAASIDDYGKPFEYHRKNARWEEVEKNIAFIRAECPRAHLIFSPTVSIYNIYRIDQFHRSMAESGIIPVNDFVPSLLVQPDECNIQVLPPDIKNEIGEKIKEHVEWIERSTDKQNQQSRYVITQFNNIITYMNVRNMHHLWPTFIEKQSKLDQIREEDFFTVFPEYSKLINSVG